MVYRKRIGIWLIFIVSCLILQMIVPLIPSIAINLKQALLDRELDGIIQELQKIEDGTVATEPIANSGNESDGSEMTDKENVESVTTALLNIILRASQYVGIVIVVFGLMQVILGFKNDDPEAISRAISTLVVGAALIGASAIVPSFFGTSGAG